VRILKIRQAEVALADGRLDEACDLAGDPDVQTHRAGQKLLTRLVRALVARGREHLQAGRWIQAAEDAARAETLGGNLPAIASLKRDIQAGRDARHDSAQRRADVAAVAREQIEQGRLTLGEQMLDGTSQDERRESLRRQAAVHRAAADEAIQRCNASLKRKDIPAAIDDLVAARAHRGSSPDVADLAARVIEAGLDAAEGDFREGHLDRSESLLRKLAPIAQGNARVESLTRALQECRRAWKWIRRGRLERAREILRLVQSMSPDASWVKGAIASASQAAEAMEALRAGPVAMLREEDEHDATEMLDETVPLRDEVNPSGPKPSPGGAARRAPGGPLPSRLAMQVDGAGSYLVLRDHRVTIGPISSPDAPDVGLLAEASLPTVTIRREEGDYLLESGGPVRVNGKLTTGRLLADGDRIALSGRTRLRFRMPNAASTSAVVELSGAKLPGTDARRLLLMDRELIVGSSSSAHIRTSHLSPQSVLHVRDGRLRCRSESPVTVNHKPADLSAGMPLGVPVRLGPTGLVVTPA
jgi:tetratricopeptide (TPR) repeat protein